MLDLEGRVWGALTVLLGLNLWMILCLQPLQIELASVDSSMGTLVVYLAPVVMVLLGVALRRASLMLFGFPLSLLLAYFFLPELDRRSYHEFSVWLPLCVSLLMFILVAALWHDGRGPAKKARLSGDTGQDEGGALTARDGRNLEPRYLTPNPRWSRIWTPYRHYFLPRGLFLVALLLVLSLGLSFGEGLPELYEASFKAQADQARVMALSFFLLVWVLVVYLYFLAPGLNLELQQRELDRAMSNLAGELKTQPSRISIVVYALVVMGSLAGLVLWWL